MFQSHTRTSLSSSAPSKGLFHSLVCWASSDLLNLASLTNATVGAGAGGSAGVGALIGIGVSAGIQAVADPQGNVGIAFSFSGIFPGPIAGMGAIGGAQVSASTASNIYALRGQSIDANASFGSGPAVGIDVSRAPGGIYTGTITVGPGVGGKAAALMSSYAAVPSALSTNCR